MLLINTSVKVNNNTGRVIASVGDLITRYDTAQMTVFEPFRQDYITATDGLGPDAATLIEKLDLYRDHLYFVPTYYKSMPGVFKNFLDIVQMRSLFHGKRVGIVSTNAKNQDYGARQFMQSLFGILEFHQATAVVVPQILILNPDDIDQERFKEYLTYFMSFPAPEGSSISVQ